MEDFNDNDAIDFILKRMPKEMKNSVSKEDIDFLMDLIYDYYDEQGFFSDEETNTEVEINEQEMFNYVADRAKEAGREDLSDDVISTVLDGEYEYGKSIGIY